MNWKNRLTPLLVLLAATVPMDSSADAVSETDCIRGLYRAATKFEQCVTAAGGISSTSIVDWQAKLLKCRSKYADAWPRLQARLPGTSCDQARFVDNGDGTLTDNLTRLVWERKVAGADGTANYSDRHDVDNVYALSLSHAHHGDGPAFTDFLNDLNSGGFAGRHDWRVPTRIEIHSMLNSVDCGVPPCVIDPLFLPAPGSFARTWSSTAYHDYPGQGWLVSGFGDADADGVEVAHHLRAVRGGL